MAVGLVELENDQQVLKALVNAMAEAGDEYAAEALRFSTVHWWTERNFQMELVFDEILAQYYPLHFADLIVPAGTVFGITQHYDSLADAVAEAIGGLDGFTICEEPEPPRPEVWVNGHRLTPIEVLFYDELRETDLAFTAQATVQHAADKRRRPDFIIFNTGGRPMVVEVDGHEYHSTREQRTNDAKRERWLAANGFDFMRFTGSEVTADAQGCVRELRETIRKRRREPET